MAKLELMKQLYDTYRKEFTDKEIVLGEGNLDSKLILIGEAPGKDEVKLSRPFVGAAGKNLTEFLNLLDIERSSIYITNAIKYRLSEINMKSGRVVNRPAKKEEIENNRRFLFEEIKIIRPSYIITLGNVPLKAVTTERFSSIGNVHGELSGIKVLGDDYMLFPLYHPASIIYNRDLKSIYLNDIQNLKSIISCCVYD